MDLNASTLDGSHTDTDTGAFGAGGQALQREWQHWPGALRSPIWHRLLATLLILGLLLTFHQVVSGAAQQGELRRQAVIEQAQATWRCRGLSAISARDHCLLQLNALARLDTTSVTENMATLVSLESRRASADPFK